MQLLEIVHSLNPKILSNGQIKSGCPFRDNHNAVGPGDGSSSFFMTPDINRYHCFSCGAKGKLVQLLEELYDVPRHEAVGLVNLIDYKEERAKLIEEFELTFTWDITKPPKEFLDRDFTKEVLKHFKVGKNPKGEIIIPLYDIKKTLLGVIFRQDYDGKKHVWYSEGFNRRTYLYNYDPKWTTGILVEGPTDLWKVWQHGYKNVAASLGTRISKEQIDLMASTPNWLLAHDADISGIKAMHFIYKELHNHVDSIQFIDYNSQDPGESTKKDFKRGVENPYSYAEFKFLTDAE